MLGTKCWRVYSSVSSNSAIAFLTHLACYLLRQALEFRYANIRISLSHLSLGLIFSTFAFEHVDFTTPGCTVSWLSVANALLPPEAASGELARCLGAHYKPAIDPRLRLRGRQFASTAQRCVLLIDADHPPPVHPPADSGAPEVPSHLGLEGQA